MSIRELPMWPTASRRRQIKRHADTLAATARLELELDIGSWQDTVAQMRELLDQLDAIRKDNRTAEDRLVDALRARVSRLEGALHRREIEYDGLEERFCALQDRSQ